MKALKLNIKKINLRVIVIITILILFIVNGLNSQTSISTGNWNNSATWGTTSPNNLMGSGVTVTISAGTVVTLSSSLDVKSNATLDVYGELIVNNSIVFGMVVM